MSKKRHGNGMTAPPDGQLRHSQVITTYGPGALVDLVNEAVLISGIDDWRYTNDDVEPAAIEEDRLYAALVGMMTARGLRLSKAQPFRRPPVVKKGARGRAGIDAVQFPRWYVCPRCRALRRYASLKWDESLGRYLCNADCPRSVMTPVRFALACRRGHLEDFPWRRFVHGEVVRGGDRRSGAASCTGSLQLAEGSVGDFAAVTVRCSCGAERALIDALPEGALPPCQGKRPWLGGAGQEDEPCEHSLKLLIRTATSAYFSMTESALTLPQADTSLPDDLSSVSAKVLAAHLAPRVDEFETVDTALLANEQFYAMMTANAPHLKPFAAVPAAVFVEALTLARSTAASQPGSGRRAVPSVQLRLDEYEVFCAASATPDPGASSGRAPLVLRRYDQRPADFERIVLVEKLRKVRALHGFVRLQPPPPPGSQAATTLQPMPVGLHEDWLPAVEIFGEGVFFTLDRARVEAWEQRPAVQQRASEMAAALEQLRPGEPFPGIRFALLHSLSHALISSLATECGYAASALEERLYCSAPDSDTWMAGVLIMTGSPGSGGTLGGLVAQGKAMGGHLQQALRRMAICSHDPVCASHVPSASLADANPDGAACHGCLYVPESCCEAFNRLLDRALLVPVMGADKNLAFFEVPE